ncbi:hypothetical protein V2J09_006866, partial [Rumex salicifolius]
ICSSRGYCNRSAVSSQQSARPRCHPLHTKNPDFLTFPFRHFSLGGGNGAVHQSSTLSSISVYTRIQTERLLDPFDPKSDDLTRYQTIVPYVKIIIYFIENIISLLLKICFISIKNYKNH